MKTAVIFGAGDTGRRIYADCSKIYRISCYIDSNYQNKTEGVNGLSVLNPSVVLAEGNFDAVILASVPGYDSLLTMCKEFGIGSD